MKILFSTALPGALAKSALIISDNDVIDVVPPLEH